MSVGNFGKVVFNVSKKKIYTFDGFKRTKTSGWKEHERYNKKPLSEFTGGGLDSVTFDIYLDASLGVNPRKELERWGKMLENGHHDILVIGGQQVGKNQWKLESISEDWKNFLKEGELITATITITLSEYVIDPKPKKKDTAKKQGILYASSKLATGGSYKVITQLTGYYTSMEAKNLKATNKTGKVYPGTYHIFNVANGQINVTRVKGVPGSWINPSKNK